MTWETLFGRLTWDSLVFSGAIENPSASEFVASGAGSLVVLGGIGLVVLLTAMKWWRPLWTDWLTSVDHKKVGIMYIVLAIIMFLRAVIEAAVMRSQQLAAYDGTGYLSADHFGQLFTTPSRSC